MKLNVQRVQFFKKIRSRLPRRPRSHISPILCSEAKTRLIAAPVDLSASSHLTLDVSCDSSTVSVNKPSTSVKKKGLKEISGFGESTEFRRITRSYCRQKENEKNEENKCAEDIEETSEFSCVELCTGMDTRELRTKLKGAGSKITGNVKVFEVFENKKSEFTYDKASSGKVSRKNSKCAGERTKEAYNSFEIKDNETVSLVIQAKNDAAKGISNVESLDTSRNHRDENCTVSHTESTIEQKPKLNSNDSDLACSEHLYPGDVSDYSSAFSDLRSDIFQESSEIDFSDCTPSIWLESGSEFSERSVGDTSPLTPTFSLFLQYGQQFCRSTFSSDSKCSNHLENEDHGEFKPSKFEDDGHENSYQLFRDRERKKVYLHDYVEEYCSKTEHGELVIQQRLQMVHWIVQQSTTKNLQKETMFLGVSLLDRFLSKGFFKDKRNLQIVGIACLALATRIEENQPFNSLRQKTYCIGSHIYSRCEVVAMEWLVQKVLDFQCFLPTIYNFLWFYLKAAKANEEVEKTSKYLAVLALLGHEQLCYWPSTVAAGLVIIASLAGNQDASCHHVMKTHLRSKDDDLPGCIKSLQWMVKYVC
ncbi:hypothetical protein NMG60_11023721 [Bertholletia excelsa]